MVIVNKTEVSQKFNELLEKYRDFVTVYREVIPIYQEMGAGAPLILQQIHQQRYGRTVTLDWMRRLITMYSFLNNAPIHGGLYLMDDMLIQFMYVSRQNGLFEGIE